MGNVSRFKTTPYKHQLKCLNEFGHRTFFALLAEMGTGKTWIIINNIAQLAGEGRIDAVMVFAPNGVHTNWIGELKKHMPDWNQYKAFAWSARNNKETRAGFENILHSGGGTAIFTANWEMLQTKRGQDAATAFAQSHNKLMIVCDESDAVKNPSAKRTKALMKLKKYSTYRRIMTGTPITNSPFDAFSQFNFLDSTILQTSSYYAFKSMYAEIVRSGPLLDHIRSSTGRTPQIVARGPNGRPKYRNLDRLSALIAPHSFRVLKSECLDLPNKIYKTLTFDLTAEQLRCYRQARDECRLTFGQEVAPFEKIVAMQKLAQITSGYFIHPDADAPVKIPGKNPKLELLKSRVDAIVAEGRQVIIWARYRQEITDIVQALEEYRVVEYHGGTPPDARRKAIDDFEAGKADVFISNQQAGGTGITLVAASYVIYYSNSFSLRDRLQSEDRAHRIGQKQNVTYINLTARNTIDEIVVSALINKKNIADLIVDKGLALLGDA